MGKGIAFFDFDNTIIHGDVGPLFGDYIIGVRYHKIKAEQGRAAADRDRRRLLARYAPYLTWLGVQVGLYKLRAVRRSRLVRLAYKSLRRIDAAEYYGMMPDFVEQEIPDRLYPEIVAKIKAHQKAGDKVVIITTGIDRLVQYCLAHLPAGITVIGCTLREKNGKLTGNVDGPLYGADKANIITAYCKAAGVKLEDCSSYTDHYSDYHMLEIVGSAYCVNPRSRLKALAAERNWTVLEPISPHQNK